MNFQRLTGPYFDGLCQTSGLRNTQLRTISGQQINPTPLLSHMGQQDTTDIGHQLEDSEMLDTWEATIPAASLATSLGASWRDFVAADQLWEINDRNGWKVYRTHGQPGFTNSGAGNRVKLVFKADTNTADLLGFEAPYVP